MLQIKERELVDKNDALEAVRAEFNAEQYAEKIKFLEQNVLELKEELRLKDEKKDKWKKKAQELELVVDLLNKNKNEQFHTVETQRFQLENLERKNKEQEEYQKTLAQQLKARQDDDAKMLELKSRVRELDLDKKEKAERIENLSRELETYQTKLNESQEKAEEYEKKLQTLMKDQKKCLDQWQAQVETWERQRTDLERLLMQEQTTAKQLSEDKREFESRLESSKQQNSALLNQIHALKERFELVLRKIKTLDSRNVSL